MATGQIDRNVQSKTKVSFRTLQLAFPFQGVATFTKSRSMNRALVGALVVGLVMMAGCPLFLYHFKFVELFGPAIFSFVIAFELISTAIVTVAVIMHFHTRPLVFDKNQGRLWRKGKFDPAIGDFASLKDVEAIQVCSAMAGHKGGPDSENYPVYELNVVMKRPPGQRIPAICHGHRDSLFADARKLAEFLGVPMVDHTTPQPAPSLGKT
jgi:hypothetical protein